MNVVAHRFSVHPNLTPATRTAKYDRASLLHVGIDFYLSGTGHKPLMRTSTAITLEPLEAETRMPSSKDMG